MTAKTPEQLVSVYGDMVYRLAYAQTRSRHDADDIFQEVFLQTVRKRPVFDSEEHEKAWLLRANAVANLRRDWYTVRKGGRLMKATTREVNLELGRPTADEALRRLTPKYRAAVHLFYYEGYTAEEIARMSGEKPSAIRTRLTRARTQLRELMKGELDDGFSQAVPQHE